MPDNKRKITVTARETIKNLNGRDCLVICVELSHDHFPPRAIPYDVALEDVHALFIMPSDDYTTLYAYFTLRIPLKGKLSYGYADGLAKNTLMFNFEKSGIETLDRKRIEGNVLEVKDRKDLIAK